MQKGFATLEIIFATLIITLLMSVAIPNAVRIVDRVSLDYETKRLYSELRFLQTMNRSGRFNLTGTGLSIDRDELVYMRFTAAPPSYQVVRGLGHTGTPVREPHYLSYGVKLSWKSGQRLYTISSDSLGNLNVKSDTLILTSRLGKTNGIVFDSVGRLQGDRQ